MKQNPCKVTGCPRNAIPTSKRGFCPVCEGVVNVIEHLVREEQAEAERVARRQATGLITPDELRRGRAQVQSP